MVFHAGPCVRGVFVRRARMQHVDRSACAGLRARRNARGRDPCRALADRDASVGRHAVRVAARTSGAGCGADERDRQRAPRARASRRRAWRVRRKVHSRALRAARTLGHDGDGDAGNALRRSRVRRDAPRGSRARLARGASWSRGDALVEHPRGRHAHFTAHGRSHDERRNARDRERPRATRARSRGCAEPSGVRRRRSEARALGARRLGVRAGGALGERRERDGDARGSQGRRPRDARGGLERRGDGRRAWRFMGGGRSNAPRRRLPRAILSVQSAGAPLVADLAR